MKIKTDKADAVFSQYIRERDDWRCQRCYGKYERGSRGLHCSHFWSRRHEATRFEERNADALCFGCHSLVEGDKQGWYRDFKIKQLGEGGYKALMIQAQSIQKKDRKMSYIICKKMYENLCKEKGIKPKKI